MTLTPFAAALFSIAAPEPESRLTSRITFAPLVIACSACVCCVCALPCALVMLYVSPAFLNAADRNGRSAVSQRTDDCVSGRSTATTAFACLLAVPPVAVATTIVSETAAATTTSAVDLRKKLLNVSSSLIRSTLTLNTRLLNTRARASFHGSSDCCLFVQNCETGRPHEIRVCDHERQSAEYLRALSEHTRLHLDGTRGARWGETVERVADPVQQRIPGGAEVAADDHGGRIEGVAEVGQDAADREARVVDNPPCARIPCGDELEQAAERQLRPVGLAQHREDGRGSGDRLETAAVAAAADGPLRPHLDVSQLAGDARRAAVEPAAEDEPRPNPGADADIHDVGEPASRSVRELAERAEVRVVVDLHRQLEPP